MSLPKNWKWRPGMRARSGRSVAILPFNFEKVPGAVKGLQRSKPVMTDPGTIGHAIALARELWGSPALQVSPRTDKGNHVKGWTCYVNLPFERDYLESEFFDADTEGAAVLAAIEAAPAREG